MSRGGPRTPILALALAACLAAGGASARADAADPALPPAAGSPSSPAPSTAPADAPSGPVNASLPPAFAARLAALEDAVAKLGEAGARDAAAAARAVADLRADIGAWREQAASSRAAAAAPASDSLASRALEQVQARLAALERLLVPGGNPADTAFPYPRLSAIFSGSAAALALIAIGAIFWLRSGGGPGRAAVPASLTRQLGEIQKAVAGLGPPAPAADGSKANEVAVTLVQAANVLRGTVDKSTQANQELAALVGRLDGVAGSLRPAMDALAAQASEVETARGELAEREKALAAASAARAEAEAQVREQVAAAEEGLRAARAQLAPYEAFWPEPFHGEGPLASWKTRLVEAFNDGSGEAGALIAALIRWQIVRRDPRRERDQWVEAVDLVGRACHAFLATQRAAGSGGGDDVERVQSWTRAFKDDLEDAFPALKLNAVYPGDRFDGDRMEAVGSNSGGRQSVHRALSWSILEKSPERTSVLRRAQVVTA